MPAVELSPDSNWLQRATQGDPSVKVRRKDLLGSVRDVVQPFDDGKTFRVTADGLDPFSLAIAGLSLSFSNNELLAKREAEKSGSAPSPASAPSGTSAEPPAGTSAAEQQVSAGAEYEAADKAVNAACAGGEGPPR